ncbi:MAG TPA: CopG family transcriptional regulator [Actinomycetota bacterium]
MERMQVYLTVAQRTALAKKAKALGVPVAVLIRRAVDRFLGVNAPDEDVDDVLRRTAGALPALHVPARSEWDRAFAAEDPPDYA